MTLIALSAFISTTFSIQPETWNTMAEYIGGGDVDVRAPAVGTDRDGLTETLALRRLDATTEDADDSASAGYDALMAPMALCTIHALPLDTTDGLNERCESLLLAAGIRELVDLGGNKSRRGKRIADAADVMLGQLAEGWTINRWPAEAALYQTSVMDPRVVIGLAWQDGARGEGLRAVADAALALYAAGSLDSITYGTVTQMGLANPTAMTADRRAYYEDEYATGTEVIDRAHGAEVETLSTSRANLCGLFRESMDAVSGTGTQRAAGLLRVLAHDGADVGGRICVIETRHFEDDIALLADVDVRAMPPNMTAALARGSTYYLLTENSAFGRGQREHLDDVTPVAVQMSRLADKHLEWSRLGSDTPEPIFTADMARSAIETIIAAKSIEKEDDSYIVTALPALIAGHGNLERHEVALVEQLASQDALADLSPGEDPVNEVHFRTRTDGSIVSDDPDTLLQKGWCLTAEVGRFDINVPTIGSPTLDGLCALVPVNEGQESLPWTLALVNHYPSLLGEIERRMPGAVRPDYRRPSADMPTLGPAACLPDTIEPDLRAMTADRLHHLLRQHWPLADDAEREQVEERIDSAVACEAKVFTEVGYDDIARLLRDGHNATRLTAAGCEAEPLRDVGASTRVTVLFPKDRAPTELKALGPTDEGALAIANDILHRTTSSLYPLDGCSPWVVEHERDAWIAVRIAPGEYDTGRGVQTVRPAISPQTLR